MRMSKYRKYLSMPDQERGMISKKDARILSALKVTP